MKKVVLLLLIFMSFKGYSQMKVGINPKTIDSSAMFQVDVNQTAGKAKGLLLPRVPLNSTTDVATILAPATGLVVYAKGGTLAEGLYVWDGAKWQKMSDANLDLDKDSTNEIQKLTFSNNVVKLSKGGDSVNLASLIIDTTSLSNRINTNKQAIIDTAAALTTKINTNKQAIIDTATSLRALVNTHISADKDIDSTNEIQKLTFSNNFVKLSKGGDSVNLASLVIDTTSLSNRINTNKQAIIDTAAALTTKINTNKQAIIDTATSLRTLVNTHITADKDIDSTNEIQKLTFSNNFVKLSKGGDSVNLAGLIIDTTSLSNRINTNKQAIIDTATSIRTLVNTHITADKDIDSTNEIQKLTFSNNFVKLSKGGDSVNLASLVIDTTSLSNRINTNKQAIIDTATSLRTLVNTHITADKDIDSTNEIQKLTFSNNFVKLSKGGDSVNLAGLIIDTTSLSNRINTNKQAIIDTATSIRTLVNTHITADKDIDSTNEIQKLTFSNNFVKLSKGGDSVNLASLVIDTTSLSNRINTNKQAIIDTATSLRTLVNTHITADKDIDSTNEIQKLTFSNNYVKLSKGGDSVNLAGLIIDTTSLSNRINTNKQAIIDTATSIRTLVNTHITADKDIDSTNEIQKLTFSNNFVKLSKGGDSVNLASLVIDTTSLSNRINTNKQAIIDTATSLRTLVNTHITADKDIDSTNEIQKLTFSNNFVKLSKGGDSVNLAGLIIDTTSLSNRINTNKQAIIDTASSLRTLINTHITADKDIDSTNEIQKLSMSGDSIIRLSKGGDSVSIKGYKNLAKNGTSISGDSVVLGGTLDRATTITTSSTNTLAISGLSKATTSDSVLMSSGSTGIVKKISVPELRKLNIAITAATSYTVSDTLDAVIFNGTANTTFTIPAASTCKGKEIRFMNYAKSASNVSITLSAAVVYEGDVSNITHTVINSKMTVYEYPEGLGSQYGNTVTIISDGTDWYKVGM